MNASEKSRLRKSRFVVAALLGMKEWKVLLTRCDRQDLTLHAVRRMGTLLSGRALGEANKQRRLVLTPDCDRCPLLGPPPVDSWSYTTRTSLQFAVTGITEKLPLRSIV